MHFSKEIKALFIITSLMLNNCFGLYKDLSNQKNVMIVNYNGGCRYCKTLIDYNNSIYSFIECSLSYDARQRFSISRGKSNETFSYLITNDSSKTFILKTFPNQANEFFITQNNFKAGNYRSNRQSS